MAIQEARGLFKDDGTQTRPKLNREIFPLNSESSRFWKEEWPYKKAVPLVNTELWAEYSGNLDYEAIANYALHAYNRQALSCYLSDRWDTDGRDIISLLPELSRLQRRIRTAHAAGTKSSECDQASKP
jgi:hypothetical protein